MVAVLLFTYMDHVNKEKVDILRVSAYNIGGVMNSAIRPNYQIAESCSAICIIHL